MKGKRAPEITHAINIIHDKIYTDLANDYQWMMAERIIDVFFDSQDQFS